jgi:hypothetical protein
MEYLTSSVGIRPEQLTGFFEAWGRLRRPSGIWQSFKEAHMSSSLEPTMRSSDS